MDKWVTGEHVHVPFTTSAYKPKFIAHRKRIIEFEKKTLEADIIPRLQRHMLKQARYVIIPFNLPSFKLLTYILPSKHAQAIDTIATTVEVTDADIKEAKKEWEGLVLSDEE